MRIINDYEVFKRAHQLTLTIYQISKTFPKDEVYGLTAQMRRAAYSIPMNLKEGSATTEAQFFHYVRIAYGSKEELEYQILLAKDLNYIDEQTWSDLSQEVNEIGKMLYAIINKK
jgi:four helix bundle protein